MDLIFQTRIRIVDQNKKTIQQENHMLQKEADDLKKQIETHCKLENELVSIKEENQRLLSKINYLEVFFSRHFFLYICF